MLGASSSHSATASDMFCEVDLLAGLRSPVPSDDWERDFDGEEPEMVEVGPWIVFADNSLPATDASAAAAAAAAAPSPSDEDAEWQILDTCESQDEPATGEASIQDEFDPEEEDDDMFVDRWDAIDSLGETLGARLANQHRGGLYMRSKRATRHTYNLGAADRRWSRRPNMSGPASQRVHVVLPRWRSPPQSMKAIDRRADQRAAGGPTAANPYLNQYQSQYQPPAAVYQPVRQAAPAPSPRHAIVGNPQDARTRLLAELQTRDITPEDYELLLTLDESIKPKTTNKSVLESLPTTTLTEALVNEVCMVCMDDFVAGDKVTTLPCKHRFHAPCIQTWLANQSVNCPLDGLPVST
eukprot:m.301302 g.301302  ORF g.301302 m.301302 type:complete len:354 (-) comp14711_c0_seq1:183-1244(-)